MKNNIFFILILPLFLSCGDFLNVDPKANVVDKDLFKNAQGFEDALYGVYSTLCSSATYGQNMSWYMTDVLAQNMGALVHSTIVPLGKYNMKIVMYRLCSMMYGVACTRLSAM